VVEVGAQLKARKQKLENNLASKPASGDPTESPHREVLKK
jgi:hypothetical protein